MSTNQAAGFSEMFSGEPMTRVTERRDHVQQGTIVDSSSSSSENQQHPHFKQLKLDQTPNQSATIMLQGPHAAPEIGLPNPSLVNAPQYSQSRAPCPFTGNASVWTLPLEEDINLNSQNQLNVPPQSAFRAEYTSQTNFGVSNQGSAQLQVDQPVQNSNNYGTVNNYLLPLSNLPTEYRLDPMARLPHSNSSAPFGIGTGGSPLPNPQWSNFPSPSQITMHEPSPSASQLGPQEIQGLLNNARGSSNFYPTSVTSSYNQLATNMPIQQRKMISLDVTTPMPNQVNWFTHGQANQGQTSNPRFPGNSLYDPIYESMGLPVDPHLRLFVVSRECGNIRL